METIELIKFKGSRRVLETLVKYPKRQFTINELAKEAGVPFASTWRMVKRWEAAGMIETGRIGKSVSVKLHESEYLDSVMSLLKISMSPQAFTVRILKNLLREERGVKEAFLFGSVARGDEELESDIDVALLVEKRYDANKLVFDVFERFATKLVPIAFLSKKEFESFMADKKGERLK